MSKNCLSHDEQSLLSVVRAALNGDDDCLGNCQMDYLLKEWFGNYMQLPPMEDQVPHHLYKAYLKE